MAAFADIVLNYHFQWLAEAKLVPNIWAVCSADDAYYSR